MVVAAFSWQALCERTPLVQRWTWGAKNQERASRSRGFSQKKKNERTPMKNIVSAVFVIAFAVLVGFAQQNGAASPQSGATKAPASTAKVLTRVEFDNLVADPSRVLLIDVRRPDEIT